MTLQSNLIELPYEKFTEDDCAAISSWLNEQCGRGTWLLRFEYGYHQWRAFYWPSRQVLQVWFVNPAHALIYKLTWGGQ